MKGHVSTGLFSLETQELCDFFMLINFHLKDEVMFNGSNKVLPREQRLLFLAHLQAELVLILTQGAQGQLAEIDWTRYRNFLLGGVFFQISYFHLFVTVLIFVRFLAECDLFCFFRRHCLGIK